MVSRFLFVRYHCRMDYQAKLKAPFGVLGILCDDAELLGIEFLPGTKAAAAAQRFCQKVCEQLLRYFAHPRRDFDLPLQPGGTAHQNKVWQAMCAIPRGQTLTYGDLAAMGPPRAVGQACGNNPIPVVIPCHRVVGKTGLGGFMHTRAVIRWTSSAGCWRMNNTDLLDEFCDSLWLEDGLSRNTLESYRRDLNKFAAWLEQQRGVSILQATHADIQGFLAHLLTDQKAKPTSTGRAISSLKRLFRYLLRQNKIATDPTLQIAPPKLPRSLPKSLTEQDVEALLDAPDVETPLGLRDRTMLEVLYATGLRVSELVTLRWRR